MKSDEREWGEKCIALTCQSGTYSLLRVTEIFSYKTKTKKSGKVLKKYFIFFQQFI
jgi:hypothetical protein